MPISSSTSYYTNSPSPPHSGEPPPPPPPSNDEPSLVDMNLAQCFQHSTQPTTATLVESTQQHSDNLVISRNQFESMTCKLDQLTRRVQQLEQTLQTDVRMILTLLQQQQQQDKEVALVKSEVNV